MPAVSIPASCLARVKSASGRSDELVLIQSALPIQSTEKNVMDFAHSGAELSTGTICA